MPQLSSPLTLPDGIPAVGAADLGQWPGLALHFASVSALTAAMVKERALPLLVNGQPITVAGEPAGVYRTYDAASQHARTVVLPSGATLTLAGDANTVIATAGAPAGGTGAVGDVAFDRSAGLAYTKTGASTWGTGVSVGGGGGSTTALADLSLSRGLSPTTRLRSGRLVTDRFPSPYYVRWPAPGTTQTLTTRPAGESGEMTEVQMSMGAGETSFRSRLRIYVDQEVVPSIDVELGTLFASHAEAHTGAGSNLSTENVAIGLVGTNVHPVFSGTDKWSCALYFPIPYSNGIHIEVYTPPGLTDPGPGSYLFYLATRREGVSSTLRLRSRGVSLVDAQAAAKISGAIDNVLLDRPNGAGSLVYFAETVLGATNWSYLEKPMTVAVDGESTPSFIRTGGEEFGATGWYFGAAQRYANRGVMLTATNGANTDSTRQTSVAWDILQTFGGIPFQSSVNFTWTNKVAPFASDAQYWYSYYLLYYIDTAVPFAPTAPQGLTATPGNGSIALAWKAPKSTGSRSLIGYLITPSVGSPVTVAPNVTTHTLTGLTNNAAVTATVQAVNTVGNSPTASATATPAASTVPGAPTSVAATAGNASATVTFVAPASNGGSPITGYTATSSPGGITASISGASAAPITVTGLTNNTAYTFTVYATNVNGNSAASSPSAAVTPVVGALASDNFDRADAATLGSTPVGNIPWGMFDSPSGTGVAGISGSRAYVYNNAAGGNAYAVISIGTSKVDISVTIAALGANPNFPGLVARALDVNNMVIAQYDAAGPSATRYAVYLKSGGNYTLLVGTTNLTPAVGDVLRLIIPANSLDGTLYVNGTPFTFTATGASTSATFVGIMGGTASSVQSTARYDDFVAA